VSSLKPGSNFLTILLIAWLSKIALGYDEAAQ